MSLYFANHFSQTVYVALVYGSGAPPFFTWRKAGWWALAGGQTCLIVEEPIRPKPPRNPDGTDV